MHEQAHILLVDDDDAIMSTLTPFLERSGFVVSTARDGEEALRRLPEVHPDLIILDVLMPKMDGRTVLRHLRQNSDWSPVILLTQVGESVERAMALEEGADDYVNKPFDPHELVARIRAVLRRARPGERPLVAAQKLTSGKLVLDRRMHRVWIDGNDAGLTPKAVTLLDYLMTHPDELVTRARLLDAVWGWDYPAGTRTVDSRIAEIRRALADDANEPRFIETATGKGYRFVARVVGSET